MIKKLIDNDFFVGPVFIIFLLWASLAHAECLHLDASTPHKTLADISGGCDVALTQDEIDAKATADAASLAAQTAAATASAFQASIQSALAGGLSVTSTGTSSLTGVYSLSQQSQGQVNAIVTYILLNGTFPGGGATMPWIDQNGVAHVWPSVTSFKAFATVYANYVAAVALYAASNGAAGALPSNQVTIP